MMQWICNITLFLILSGILLELIADTKYYKFARWVAGIILLLQVIQPMTNVEDIGGRFLAIFDSFDYALGTDKVLEEIYRVNDRTESTVLEEYKKSVSEQIDKILQKNGLGLATAEITVAEDGTLAELKVRANYLDGREKSGILIPTVAPVRIGEEKKQERVSPLELYIRENLAEFYQVDENKIEVVIQEAE